MITWKRQLFCVVVFCVLILRWPSQANAESPAGVYVGQVQGQRIELRMEADGRASLLGEQGSWRAVQGGVILSGQQGSVRAQIRGTEIIFEIEGTRLVLRKQGAASTARQPANTSARGKPFAPKGLLKGKRYKIQGVDGSFVLPKGWVANYGEVEGQAGLSLTNRKFPGSVILLTAKLLSQAEASMSVPALLQATAAEELGSSPVRVITGPTALTVDRKPAGLLVLEGSDGIRTIRARLGGIKVQRFGVVLLALYDAKLDAQLAPVFETVLATFRAKAPKVNRALTAKLVGCWSKYDGETSSSGSSMTQTTYRFDSQGRYSYRYNMSVSTGAGGVSDSDAAVGTYAVYGNEAMLESDKGETSSLSVRRQGQRLFLGGTRYIPCS